MSNWTNIAFTNIGKRSNNQDFFCVKSIKSRRKKFFVMLVCDGVGGRPNGAECSLAVGNKIISVVVSYLLKRKSHRTLGDNDAVRISKLLSELSPLEAPQVGRTTASLMIIDQKEHKAGYTCVSIWAGDSRIYSIEQSGLCKQISHDHYNEEGHLSVVFGGDGKLHGLLSHTVLYSKAPLAYVVTSDGMNSQLTGLFKFFFACIFHNISDNGLFESKAKKYLGSLVSDNYSITMLYNNCPNNIILNSFKKMQVI